MEKQPQAPQLSAAETAQQEADAHFAQVQTDREAEARTQYLDTLYKQPFETDANSANWKAEHDRYNQALATGAAENISRDDETPIGSSFLETASEVSIERSNNSVEDTINGDPDLKRLRLLANNVANEDSDLKEGEEESDTHKAYKLARRKEFLNRWNALNDLLTQASGKFEYAADGSLVNPDSHILSPGDNNKYSQALAQILNEAGHNLGASTLESQEPSEPTPASEPTSHYSAERQAFVDKGLEYELTTPEPEEKAESSKSGEASHASGHHERLQTSKRPTRSEEPTPQPGTETEGTEAPLTDEEVRAMVYDKSNPKLDELRRTAENYAVRRDVQERLKASGSQREVDVDGTLQEYNRKKGIIGDIAHPQVLEFIQGIADAPAPEDKVAAALKAYEQPVDAKGEAEVAAEVKPVPLTGREKLRDGWRTIRSGIHDIFHPDKSAKLFDDEKSPLYEKVSPDATKEERQAQAEQANLKRMLGADARLSRRIGNRIKAAKERFGMKLADRKLVTDERLGREPLTQELETDPEVEAKAQADYAAEVAAMNYKDGAKPWDEQEASVRNAYRTIAKSKLGK